MTGPLTHYLSRQAAHPHGLGGRLIGRLWVRETATVNDAAVELLAPAPGESILEIGFGPGRTVGLLADRSASVTGVDVSEEMLRLATRRNATLIATRSGSRCPSTTGPGSRSRTTPSTRSSRCTTSTSGPSRRRQSTRSPACFAPGVGCCWCSEAPSILFRGDSIARSIAR